MVKGRQVCPDFLVRTLEIRQENASRTVIQFHYSTWPDHGIPTAVTPILELVRLMRDVQATETRPILVHCSAGCGRTGTICSIDYVWALLRAGKLKSDFSLYSIIRDMRMQRIAMVQTLEQYMLCFKAVAALFQQQLKIIDSHTYENLDQYGEPLILRSLSSDSEHSSSTDSSTRPNSDGFSDSCQTDVKTLINSWETSDPIDTLHHIRRAPSLDSLLSSSVTKPTHPTVIRSDKLIGKATVIRRPSIAKLKAMFETLQTTDAPSSATGEDGSGASTITRYKSKVKRSHSAKEIPSSSSSSRITIASKSTNAKLTNHLNSVHTQSTSSMVHATQAAFSKSSTESSRRSTTPESLSDSLAEEFDMTNVTCHTANSGGYKESIIPTPLAPPKPPRTYQHHLYHHPPQTLVLPSSGTPVNLSSNTVTAPTPSILHRSAGNNEYIVPQFVSLPPPQAPPAAQSTQRLPPYHTLSSLHHHEPIYQQLIPRHFTTSQLSAPPPPPPPQAIYGSIAFKRDIHLSVPNLMPTNLVLTTAPSIPPRPSFYPSSVPHHPHAHAHHPHHQRVPSTYIHRPIPTYEEIYENLPKKRPILMDKSSIRPTPPVTYVRPQPNPSLTCIQESSAHGKDKVNAREANCIDKSSSSSKMKSRGFSLSVFFGRNKKDSSTTTSQSSTSPTSSTVSSNKSKKLVKSNDMSSSSNKLHRVYKKSMHSRSVQNLNSDSNHLQVPQGEYCGGVRGRMLNRFSSFNDTFSLITGNNSKSGLFKPPHSHRFSPPTQWTQV